MKLTAIPPLLMTAICLFVGQYLLTLFIRFNRTTSRKADLSFAITAFAAAFFNLASAFFYNADSFADAALWERLRYAALALFSPGILLFIFDLTGRRKRRIFYITGAFTILMLIYTLTDLGRSPPRAEPTRVGWMGIVYYESEPNLLTGVLFGLVLVAVMMSLYLLLLRTFRGEGSASRAILFTLCLHALTIVNDFCVYVGLYTSIYLSEYGFLFLILGLGSALQSNFVNAHLRMTASEEKYRRLVEDSRDIVFSLDPEGRLQSINQSVQTVLDYPPDELIGVPLANLIHASSRLSLRLKKNLLAEKLRAVLDSDQSREFEMDMATRRNEPVELKLRLERAGAAVVLGKAYYPAEDLLLKFRDTEQGAYTVGNNFAVAEMLSRRMAANLRRYLDQDEIMAVRTGIREMLANAIEHGNLGITFEEKSAAVEEGNLTELIQSRQADPRYRDRKVLIKVSMNPRDVVITITDEGRGFDHEAMLNRDLRAKGQFNLRHGRGILMTRSFFDELTYNEAGNEVRLRKIFPASDGV